MLRVAAAAPHSVLSLLLAVAGLAGCEHNRGADQRSGLLGPPAAEAAYEGTPEDFAAIRKTLADRAEAIEQGDRTAFLATIDTSNQSTRRSQLELFDNLQDLPLESIRYESDDFGDTGDRMAGDGPRLRPDAVEIVRLAGVDRRAVENDVNMTFVLRDGRWVLGMETEFESATPWNDAISRPWFGARIDVAHRGPTIVVADHAIPSIAEDLATRSASELDDIAAFLRVPASRRVLIDATTTGRTADINADGGAAAAIFFPVLAPDGQRFSGWRIKFNPRYVDEMLGAGVVLRHELTHFVARNLVRVAPVWLSEGLAEYVAYLPSTSADLVLPSDLAKAIRDAEKRLPLSGQFQLQPEISYPVSHAAVTVLVRLRGMSGIRELAEAYASEAEGTGDPYADFATAWVLRRVYGFGPDELARRAWALIEGNQ